MKETKTQEQFKAPAGLLQMHTEVTDVTHLKQNMGSKGRDRHQGQTLKQCGLVGFKRLNIHNLTCWILGVTKICYLFRGSVKVTITELGFRII